MNNLDKIKKISSVFSLFITALITAVPLFYIVYWVFINQTPPALIDVSPTPAEFLQHELTTSLQLAGFAASVFPMTSLLYILVNLKKLFLLYKDGKIFSFDHVIIFKKIAKGILFWVLGTIVYGTAKSVIFSIQNPPGSKMISVSFGSQELTTLIIGIIVFIISWVMDEGRILAEENKLTI